MLEVTVVNFKKKHKKIKLFIFFLFLLFIFIIIYAYSYDKNITNNSDNTYSIIQNTIYTENNNTFIEYNNVLIENTLLPLPVYSAENAKKITKIYNSDYKRVFLTFDDGPSSNITPLLLDLLKTNNIKASFFVLGTNVEKNPNIVKRAYEEGHYIANHGFSHIYKNIYKDCSSIIEEFNKTENSIQNAIGKPEYHSHLFRFPGGSVGGKYNEEKKTLIPNLKNQEICYVDWNCLTGDSVGTPTKELLMESLINTSQNKMSIVVLMHDNSNKILTYEIMQEVIDYFKNNEYVFENFYDIMK